MHTYKFIRFFLASVLSGPRTNDLARSIQLSNPVVPVSEGKNKDRYNQYLKKGLEYEFRFDQNAAIAEYSKAIVLDPKNTEAYVFIAGVYQFGLHDYASAIKVLKEVLVREPSNRKAAENLISAYYHSGKSDEAVKYLSANGIGGIGYDNVTAYGFPEKNDNEIFYKTFRYNLNLIIDTAKKQKVRIYLMTYAQPRNLNATIRDVASKKGIPLIDNEPVYTKLMSAPGFRETDLFQEGDCHCNNRGYAVMADNVYKALKAAEKL